MASRLFHAVVGVGIALATSSAACLGVVDEQPARDEATEAYTPSTPAPPNAAPGTYGAGTTDASDGGAATSDAPFDAPFDAFCDAAWPTTKGNTGGPTCGAVEACAEAGPAPRCFQVISGATCDPAQAVAVWCVGAAWQCPAGSLLQDGCKCFQVPSGPPCP